MTKDENDAGAEGVRVAREPGEDELRREARALAFKRVSQVAGITGLVLLLAFSAWTISLIRDTQVGNRTTLQQAKAAATSAKATADRIEDCTTPGGECFERSQRQTSGAVAGINTITVRAQACTLAITRQIPAGTRISVDEVAQEIEECIKASTVKVDPQRVVPAPKPTPASPTATPGSEPTPKESKHPKGGGTPGVPSPTSTPTGGPAAVTDQLCRLLLLDPCLLP